MKKYILLTLFIFFFTQGREILQKEAREWDAQAYAQGNKPQEEAALKILNELNIDFTNKKVLDIGCRTGNVTATIATTAQQVHGIDASNNMIEYAQHYYDDIKNLTFEHCFAEDFIPHETYDYAVSILCLHWIKDKQKVFENINRSLTMNGEFIGTIYISSNSAPLSFVVLKELLDKWQPVCDFLRNTTLTESSMNRYLISNEEFNEIIKTTGFETITMYTKKSSGRPFKNREEFAAFQRPIAMRRPLFKELPEEKREWFFNEFIDLFLTKLEKDENNHYLYIASAPATIFHLRKMTELK